MVIKAESGIWPEWMVNSTHVSSATGIDGTAGGEADGPESVGEGCVDNVDPVIISFC